MSEDKVKTFDSSSSKALLYSELLDTTVPDHVRGLLQKKKKSHTYHVQRSSVLDRVSKLLHSMKDDDQEVQNIEIVEEGEPVIDMSVTLIEREEGSECDSDNDTENEELESRTNDRKLICSDSDSELSENESEENVHVDKNILVFSDSDSEVSENESEILFKNQPILSDLDSQKHKNEGAKNLIIGTNLLISDSENKTLEREMNVLKDSKLLTSNFGNENESAEVLLEGQKYNKLQESDDRLSKHQSSIDQERNLGPPRLDFEVPTSDPSDPICKDEGDLYNLDLPGKRKRKLISVIEEVDGRNVCLSTKQKRV